jgi:hypothetical protein
MTGYRQSSFDPNAFEQPGPPLKPYNWVQWTGIGFAAVGVAIILLEWAGKLGLIPRWIDDAGFAPVSLMLIGMVLINSRRAPSTQAGSEQLANNRRILILTVAICAVVLGATLVIEFT